jgi:bacterial/archaeal transporter family protein
MQGRTPMKRSKKGSMDNWVWYAVLAAALYGLHQVFTKLAADHIGDGIGGLIVEATATVVIAFYLGWLWFFGEWKQQATGAGVLYSILTGVCVGAGTVAFFLLFQKGAPVSAVPSVLAAGAALMALIGLVFFKESFSWMRILGIALSLIGLLLLRQPQGK